MTNDEADSAREDGRALATALLVGARHDPSIALAVLAAATDAVLATIPNHDERYAMLTEFIRSMEDAE